MNYTSPSISVRQSTNILQHNIINCLPKKIRNLANFGMQSLVNTPFVSCNANARMTGSGTTKHAAEMRMCRLLNNQSIATLLMSFIQQSIPLNKSSVLNIDFSNFGGVAVLVAALQTGKGRALPWALEALISNIQGTHLGKLGHARHKIAYRNWKQETGGDQYDIVLRLIANIDCMATTSPCLVFDRGFAVKRILNILFLRNGYSYIRMKDYHRVEIVSPNNYSGIWHVKDLPTGSYKIIWRGIACRVVIATTSCHKQNLKPWIIATNDYDSSIQQIAKLYYHRFEIEETFRDWKSILGLRHAHISNWKSLQVLLSFASIATLSAWLTRRLTTTHINAHNHIKKKCSFFRMWYEQLQFGIRYEVAIL
jgi:hypothetical protein